MNMSIESTEYVRVPVTSLVNNAPVNISADQVFMAFTASGDPATWYPASWETLGNGALIANCLVGPSGAIQLLAGTYQVWVKVIDNPETVVLAANGLLTIS